MRILEKGMFFATGTDSASYTIPETIGQAICSRLGWDSPGAGTLVIYRAGYRTKASAAVSNSTSLVIVATSGTVEGYTPTTSDYVLVFNSSGTGTKWYLQSISDAGSGTGATKTLTLGGAIYCSANDAVYIVSNSDGDIITLTTASESVRDLYDAFCSRRCKPVHLVLAATGTCRFQGLYNVED